jgi:hypothetical protein
MFSMSLLAQINTQGVLSNDQALLIAQQDGYQTLNVPIFSRYDGITTDQARILDALKRNYIIEYSVVDPVNQIITTEITYTGREFIAANLNQGNVLKTYLAVALVEVDRVLEVRQHQTKNNAQTVDYQFRVLNNSKVGKALKWFQEGNTLTHTVDFINTSNGWKKDMDDRNDPTITSYRSSRYGSEGLSSYKSKLKDIEFVNNIETNIIGRWERSTDKEKKREHYIFNEDGTYTNYKARKDITTQGKYKFSTNLGDKIYVSLIPKEGKNTSKSLQRSKWGMYIGGVPFRKEGSATSTNSKKVDPTALAESQQKILERKKKLYSNKIPGFWKSPSGKTTLDIRENKTLILKTKKFTYENATYDINILNGKLNLVIFDKDLVEVFNQELKVVRDDQMVLGGRTYTKF